jgi:small ligand-binding sensory domain FIST
VSRPRIASRVAVGTDPVLAAREAARTVAEALGCPADLVVAFASPELCRDPDAVRAAITAELSPAHLIGCTGAGVVGTGVEIEDRPAVVVWGAILPGARITPIRAVGWRTPDGRTDIAGWPTEAGTGHTGGGLPGPDDVVLALADPYTFPIDLMMQLIAAAPWQPPVVGGLAAGGTRPGDHVLWLDGQYTHEGLVGVSIGGIDLVTAVSQGCVGVGPEMVVTDADGGGRIFALAGAPALAKVQAILDDLDDRSLERVNSGITLGIVMNENTPDYDIGDYLMRGILGANPDDGSIHVGERVRTGQTVRLHVRDERSATEDLISATRGAVDAIAGDAAGALVFTCTARGSAMFAEPHHDARVIGEILGDPPVAGLFCNGEFGAVGGRNFLHGFTATIAIFGNR